MRRACERLLVVYRAGRESDGTARSAPCRSGPSGTVAARDRLDAIPTTRRTGHLRSEAERAEKKRDGRRAWIGIIVAVVAIVPTLYQVYADSGPDRPEEFVESCRAEHGLLAVPALRASEDGPWEGCSWPPAPGAADDGFYRVGVESRELPGSTYADKYTRVQIVESSCTHLLLQYRFDNQGTQAQLPPLRAANDQVVSGYDGSAENPYGLGLSDPSDIVANGRLVVFKNDRYSLVRLECTSPP